MPSLQQKTEALSNFLRMRNLKKQAAKGEVALLVIDVQKKFCDPKEGRGSVETERVSARIQSLIPAFRKAGIPVYAVYYSDKQSDIDFYKFTPSSKDALITKTCNSAFIGSRIKDVLEKEKRKLLLTCGFNLSACVERTVNDALMEGFDICLLRDLAANGKGDEGHTYADNTLKKMREKGVVIEQSITILKQLWK